MSSEHKYMYIKLVFYLLYYLIVTAGLFRTTACSFLRQAFRLDVPEYYSSVFSAAEAPRGDIVFNPPGGFKCILQNGMIFSSE